MATRFFLAWPVSFTDKMRDERLGNCNSCTAVNVIGKLKLSLDIPLYDDRFQ